MHDRQQEELIRQTIKHWTSVQLTRAYMEEQLTEFAKKVIAIERFGQISKYKPPHAKKTT